ncbi:MAG TPA: hypothetical protein VF942_18995, partial [Acidimicrobiales bacterium]
MQPEPALRFWLEALAAEGGVIGTTGDPTFVVVPDRWQRLFELPAELSVTADPEVAREDGALFLIAGESAVAQVAELVLDDGDAGWAHLAWPAVVPPSREAFQSLVRDQITVEGGTVSVDGEPAPAFVPVLKVGVRVRYAISLDDRFEEKEEIWVEGRSGLSLDPALGGSLDRALP